VNVCAAHSSKTAKATAAEKTEDRMAKDESIIERSRISEEDWISRGGRLQEI
jgi:hypothetical protein